MSLHRPQVPKLSTPKGDSGSGVKMFYCNLCHSNCTSAVQLVYHVLGSKHKRKLYKGEYEELNNEISLSYFLKTYMESYPVVGLECITEMKERVPYTYSCQLCGFVDADLMIIVGHITNYVHIENYIKKHFTYLLPHTNIKSVYAKAMRDAVEWISIKQGNNKEIQVVPPNSEGKTRGASEDTLPSKPNNDGKTREVSKDTLPSKPNNDGKTREVSKDTLPSKPKSDSKTREVSEDTLPSKPNSDGKTREASEDTLPSKPKSDGKTREVSKDTPPSKHKSGNSFYSKLSPLPYRKTGLDENHESYHYNRMLQKSVSVDPPLAKKSRRSPGGDWEALPSTAHISKHQSSHYNKLHAIRMDCTATQEFEFRTNDEFLEYLSNFVISNDEDVLFIRTIIQNCIKALTSFQEEEAEKQKTSHTPEAPLADISRTAYKIPGILEDEMESYLSDSETTLLRHHPNPPSDSVPKDEATDLFFSSIKEMDESEVVSVFQKLAATNPQFQEMDIPTVIKFLKDSGRLKMH